MCQVSTGYHGTSEIEHGLCACAVDNPLAKARGLSLRTSAQTTFYLSHSGWSGGAKVLGKLPVPGRPTIWMIVGQGPIALAVGAGEGGLDIFTLLYPFSPLSRSLRETARYRLKYCLKGPLNPVQPTKISHITIDPRTQEKCKIR